MNNDAATLAAASSDPAGFIAALDGPVVLDEIQKAPALLPAIKLAVDRRRRPGRFLLTGSADVLALPRVSESLAGRMEVLTLWPLSQGELAGRREGFIDARVWIPDTGLLGHLAGLTPTRLAEEPAAVGPLLETFVVSELAKQTGWRRSAPPI